MVLGHLRQLTLNRTNFYSRRRNTPQVKGNRKQSDKTAHLKFSYIYMYLEPQLADHMSTEALSRHSVTFNTTVRFL